MMKKILKRILISLYLIYNLMLDVISFTEWLNVGILKKADDYPWKCEGLPWYYESPKHYSIGFLINWITGTILMLMILYFLKNKKHKEFKQTIIALIIYNVISLIICNIQIYTYDFSLNCNP